MSLREVCNRDSTDQESSQALGLHFLHPGTYEFGDLGSHDVGCGPAIKHELAPFGIHQSVG